VVAEVVGGHDGHASVSPAADQRFEGAEKKVLVACASPSLDLRRSLSRSEWDGLLASVGCTVVSHRAFRGVDSYVLSESSLFVGRGWILLKTCGRTTPLRLLPGLLTGLLSLGVEPSEVRYTRSPYVWPASDQPVEHRSWCAEVEALRWHLASVGLDPSALSESDGAAWSVASWVAGSASPAATTVELALYDLPARSLDAFFVSADGPHGTAGSLGAGMTESGGVGRVLLAGAPDGRVDIDGQAFRPCGYSCNASVGRSGLYATVHITPESHQTYVSIELSLPAGGPCVPTLCALASAALNRFRPGRVCALIAAERPSLSAPGALELVETLIALCADHGYRERPCPSTPKAGPSHLASVQFFREEQP